MSYLFLGEGPNDKLIVPIILEVHNIEIVQSDFKTWKSIHGRGLRGFKKKAMFAIKLARLDGKKGLVATLDADNQPNRIKDLDAARKEDRENLSTHPILVVIGQANPEIEAWLLDDAEAVKKGLGISSEAKIPSPYRVSDVKVALDALFEESSIEGRANCLASVARQVQCERSRSPDKSGLRSFIEGAKTETIS